MQNDRRFAQHIRALLKRAEEISTDAGRLMPAAQNLLRLTAGVRKDHELKNAVADLEQWITENSLDTERTAS